MRRFNFPARARAVQADGTLTPEFLRALQGLGEYGRLYMTGNATATASAGKVQGTTTAGLLYGFSHSNGRLTYTGSASTVLRVNLYASLTATAGDTVTASVAINGAIVSSGPVTVGSGTAFVATQMLASLSSGDYLEAFVSNSNGNPVTVTDLSLVAS